MTGRSFATLTALMVMGVTTVVHAQQTSDTLRHDRTHDQRIVARDTLKVQRDIAVRDSLRAVLEQDQSKTAADQKQIDSLKAVIATAKKATPRDTLAINRELAAVAALQKQHGKDLNQAQRDKKRLGFAERTVQRESHATISARQDLRDDRPKSGDSTRTSK